MFNRRVHKILRIKQTTVPAIVDQSGPALNIPLSVARLVDLVVQSTLKMARNYADPNMLEYRTSGIFQNKSSPPNLCIHNLLCYWNIPFKLDIRFEKINIVNIN